MCYILKKKLLFKDLINGWRWTLAEHTGISCFIHQPQHEAVMWIIMLCISFRSGLKSRNWVRRKGEKDLFKKSKYYFLKAFQRNNQSTCVSWDAGQAAGSSWLVEEEGSSLWRTRNKLVKVKNTEGKKLKSHTKKVCECSGQGYHCWSGKIWWWAES